VPTHRAVTFILYHYKDFQSGLWPDPLQAADLGLPIHSHRSRAAFQAAVDTGLEVALRVKRCGQDGMIVEERFGMHWGNEPIEPGEIALKRHIPEGIIRRSIKDVILYCSDEEFEKGLEYHTWRRLTKYQRNRRGNSVAKNS